jgi:hypothetical protein
MDFAIRANGNLQTYTIRSDNRERDDIYSLDNTFGQWTLTNAAPDKKHVPDGFLFEDSGPGLIGLNPSITHVPHRQGTSWKESLQKGNLEATANFNVANEITHESFRLFDRSTPPHLKVDGAYVKRENPSPCHIQLIIGD